MSISNFLRSFGFSKNKIDKEYQKEIDELNEKLQLERHAYEVLGSEFNKLIGENLSLGVLLQSNEKNNHETVAYQNFSRKWDEVFSKKTIKQEILVPQQQLELDLKPKETLEKNSFHFHARIKPTVAIRLKEYIAKKNMDAGMVLEFLFNNIYDKENPIPNKHYVKSRIKAMRGRKIAAEKRIRDMKEMGFIPAIEADKKLGSQGSCAYFCQKGLKHTKIGRFIFCKPEDIDRFLRAKEKKKKR